MLVPNQTIETTWMPANREHYIALGYKYTKMRQSLEVKVEDLPKNSHMKIRVVCDYCGKEFDKQYVNFLREHDDITNKDCCYECCSKKTREVMQKTYGVDNFLQLESTKEKIGQTCLEKYGTERACQSQEVKDKIILTNLERYGNKMALQNPEIKKKAEQSCLERFGVTNVFASPEIQEKIKQTNLERYGEGNIAHTPEISAKIKQNNFEKYGVLYTTQVPEVITKIHSAYQRNGTAPTSKMEQAIINMLVDIYGVENCVQAFSLDKINMDCLLKIDDVQIDVEYDGWYWHKNKQEYDKRRNCWVIDQGYKVLRIRSNDLLPTREQIIEAVDYLVKDNHKLAYIDLDI
nr:MAG TPA: endonuclease-like protein [Caudoviricetes sp.]